MNCCKQMSDCSDVIYLNNAATSWPKPPGVASAVQSALTCRPGAAHRGGILDFDVFDAVRARLASLLGVKKPSRIALGANATWGLNLAIFGYPFRSGDTVLTTKAEHNSVLRPLYALERRGLIHVIYLDVDGVGRISPDTWKRALEEYKPRLAVFTHASNVTGAVNDAALLTAMARERGSSVLLDASQTIGWTELASERWGVDMLAFTGHKYLLGPQGTGGLYVREGLSLTPHLLGGTGIHSDLDTMPEEMPLRLEAGTGNEPSFCGLLAALDWAREHPVNMMERDVLLRYIADGLVRNGANVIRPGGNVTPVLSFTIDGMSSADIGDILQGSYDIICRTGLHCAPKMLACLGRTGGTVRLSLSRFTTRGELDAVIEAVRDMAED